MKSIGALHLDGSPWSFLTLLDATYSFVEGNRAFGAVDHLLCFLHKLPDQRLNILNQKFLTYIQQQYRTGDRCTVEYIKGGNTADFLPGYEHNYIDAVMDAALDAKLATYEVAYRIDTRPADVLMVGAERTRATTKYNIIYHNASATTADIMSVLERVSLGWLVDERFRSQIDPTLVSMAERVVKLSSCSDLVEIYKVLNRDYITHEDVEKMSAYLNNYKRLTMETQNGKK